MSTIGFNININDSAVMYGVFIENFLKSHQDFYWSIICTVVNKIWETRCAVVIHQTTIPRQVVFRQIITELNKQRAMDIKQKKTIPWH